MCVCGGGGGGGGGGREREGGEAGKKLKTNCKQSKGRPTE